MNTAIEIMYRDAANYKKDGRIVLAGGHTHAQVAELTGPNCVDGEGFFVPEAVGLPALRQDWDDELDHAFHTIAAVGETPDAPTDGRSLDQIIAEMRKVDWDAAAAEVATRHQQ